MTYTMVGTVTAIDEKGTDYEAVCDLGCPHTVTPVVRRSVTIVEERKVRDLFTEGWANTGPQPPRLPGYRAVEEDGTEWIRDWDGWANEVPGHWKTADGRRAEDASSLDPAVKYAGRKSQAYRFIDLTSLREA